MNRLTVVRVTGPGRTTVSFSALLTLAVVLSACNGGASGPTTPTPQAAPLPPVATYALSGTVSEMTAGGSAPIEGARVSETSSGLTATTDANGRYTISGLSAMRRSILVTKEGYVSGIQTTTMSGDTQLDIRLDRVLSYILSGVVFEMTPAGPSPIEGVEIYCDSCGSPDGHTFVHTDANGFYSLAWTMNGVHPLFVRKAGYDIVDPTGSRLDTLGRIQATVTGDTRFDIQLARR